MAKRVGGLRELLLEELQDLFDAEKQLVRALPKMAKSATDSELESALREHLEVTRGQVQRLEHVFQSMDMRARSKPCRGMKGIVEEGQEVMEEGRDESILDSAIAASGRKVEHYEMMGYEAARSIAQQLGMREAAQLLQQTLQEEMQADRQLAQISKRLLKGSGREQGDAAESTRGRRTQAKRGSRSGKTRGAH
jgi:ferritin-like metal-binding protein YciE